MVRDGAISPLELVDAHLAQIAARNSEINAFVMVLAEEARERARALERGDRRGLLYGVPITVKDSFDMAGIPSRVGSPGRPLTPAARDATAVARLLAEGAIVLGRTNTPEMLARYDTDNAITGRTNNPWDLERTPGGSSGGEAAAIAAYCSPGGVASDGGGSIRMPAHFCGIAGLKPTPGTDFGYGAHSIAGASRGPGDHRGSDGAGSAGSAAAVFRALRVRRPGSFFRASAAAGAVHGAGAHRGLGAVLRRADRT